LRNEGFETEGAVMYRNGDMNRMRPLLILISVLLVPGVRAQDIDNVVSPNGRKPFTFLDEIDSDGERAAFLRLYHERDTARRRSLADAFLRNYDQSWLLAPVYEIAAKTAIDLDDFPAALRFARESLRLLPENPLLLVPVANVQVQQNLFREAVKSAIDALDYLDRFGRPVAIPEREWPGLRDALKASSHYVLGKVAAADGLAVTGALRKTKLDEAAVHLWSARDLNPGDSEAAYLLGLVQAALGNTREAAAQFEAASRRPGPLRQKSIDQVNALKRRGVTVTEPPPTPGVGAATKMAVRRPARYAGSASCRRCHAVQHTAWEHTGMARMFRPYRPENVMGNFDRQQFESPTGVPLARMKAEGERHFFETRGAEGGWQRYPVDYTIGSKWQQAYATRTADGQIHVFPIQYNLLEKTWLNYWKLIDPPGSERTNLDGFHNLAQGTNYQINCAPCHTSQLGAPRREGARPQDLNFREAGVNCEMCHGPSADHVAAMAIGKSQERRPTDPPVDFRKLDHREYVRICAQCHMQSAMRELGSAGEYNYSNSGDSFMPRYPSRPFVEFSRRAFYKDGRFRETTFIVEALMRASCYRRGQITCGNCHDPHPPDATANPVSLKYLERPDQMCLQCHANYAALGEAHTHHPATSEASRCVSCHMPRIMNSVLFKARTHQVDDIPKLDMTERFGQQDSPNSCLLCHREKDVAWVATHLRGW
jgi:predicted CXXCH cytochrome family protein